MSPERKYFNRSTIRVSFSVERDRIPVSDERYRVFYRTISNRVKYVRFLASLYGFNSPTTDYSAVPNFSDEENQEAVEWNRLANSYKQPRNAYEWLRLYAQYIFTHCRPRAIIALSKLPQLNQDNPEGEAESELKKTHKN